MAKIIEARVIQKVATEAEWMANPLKLYQGEVAYVSDKYNFKLNTTDIPKTFAELEYYYKGDVISGVLPTDDLASKLDGVYRATISGDYSGVVVKEGYYTLLRKKDDGSWVLESEVKMPMQNLKSVENIEISSINLFNKNNLLINKGFDSSNGAIIDSNSSNAVTDNLIKISSLNKYGLAKTGYNKGEFFAIYIAEFDINKNYIGFVNLTNKSIYIPSINTEYVRLNPNAYQGFDDFCKTFIFAELTNFPIKYQPFLSNSKDYIQNDLSFYEKYPFSKVDTNTSKGINFNTSTNTLSITAGEKIVKGELLFSFESNIKHNANCVVVTRFKGNFKEILPLLVNGEWAYGMVNVQRDINLFYGTDNDFYITTKGYFLNTTKFRNFKIANSDITLTESINLIVENYILYLDKTTNIPSQIVDILNTKLTPINNEINRVEASIKPIVNQQIDSRVPTIIEQQIGSDVSDYISKHVNDFNFDQPNYIQANSDFKFENLTGVMNGKFVSIIEDIDLQGKTIDFVNQGVKQLKLVFNGGRILNGKIKPNKTLCVFNSLDAFKNVEILGRFENESVRPESLGALLDGVDGGIGVWTYDDSFAFNQAFKFARVVKCIGNKTAIIKKSLTMQDNSLLLMDNGFTLKLGDASNCTLIKNNAIDFPNTGLPNGVTYPSNYKRDSYISIKGGIIDGNALKQFRENSAGKPHGGNPIVDNTPTFRDGDGMTYFGVACKFADIDTLNIENVTFKDSRTYHLMFGGITNFKGKNIKSLRSIHLENQDGLHAHGLCQNIYIDGLVGHSGDDLFAVTTMESGIYSVRVGDVGNVHLKNVTETGIHPDATIENPILAPLYNDYQSFGPLRFTYTNEVINNIVVENLSYNNPMKECGIILSNLFNANSGSDLPHGFGKGRINSFTLDNVTTKGNTIRPIGLGTFTTIGTIRVNNYNHNLTTNSQETCIIADTENWFPNEPDNFSYNKIDLIEFNSVRVLKGDSNPGLTGYIKIKGEVSNVVINNFTTIETSASKDSHQLFAKGNIKKMSITNSSINVKKMFELTNSDLIFNETNNSFNYKNEGVYYPTLLGAIPKRANTSNLMVSNNPTNPIFGDKILKSDGYYIYTDTWVKL